jgi:hypothetical protein
MSSHKRSSPDSQSVDWKDTQIEELKRVDLDNLLKSREIETETQPKNKEEIIALLKQKGTVMLENIENLTNVQILSELRLRGLNDDNAKKDILLARYRGEDNQPPRKKQRIGKRGKKSLVYVALYFPPTQDSDKKNDNNNNNNNNSNEDEDNEAAHIIGVFKKEDQAYETGVNKIMSDIENKSDKDHKTIAKQFEKKDYENDYKKQLSYLETKSTEIFGEGSDPYVKIARHFID